jgi:hypothetical protein
LAATEAARAELLCEGAATVLAALLKAQLGQLMSGRAAGAAAEQGIVAAAASCVLAAARALQNLSKSKAGCKVMLVSDAYMRLLSVCTDAVQRGAGCLAKLSVSALSNSDFKQSCCVLVFEYVQIRLHLHCAAWCRCRTDLPTHSMSPVTMRQCQLTLMCFSCCLHRTLGALHHWLLLWHCQVPLPQQLRQPCAAYAAAGGPCRTLQTAAAAAGL